MLTAVVSSFYSQRMRAGIVDPRQLRMATPFIKSSGRHLCGFSLPVLQIFRKVYINSPETVSLSFLRPLRQAAFCHNASTGQGGNQAPVPQGATGLLVGGDAGHGGPRHPPSARGTCGTPQQPLRPQVEGRGGGSDGKVGASVRGATPRPPTLRLSLCSAPSVSLCHLLFAAWAKSRLGWAFLVRVLHAWSSAAVLLHSGSNEYDKQRCPLGFAVTMRWDLSKNSTLGSLGAHSPLPPWGPRSWHCRSRGRGTAVGQGGTWSKVSWKTRRAMFHWGQRLSAGSSGVACYWQEIRRVCTGFLTFPHFLPPGLRFK